MLSNKTAQRGAASALIVFFLLAIVAVMVSVSQLMSNASLSGHNQKSHHLQALYLAESALGREINALNANAFACGTLSPNPQSFAGGSFETLSSTPLATDPCTVKVQGTYNSVITVLEAQLDNIGGTGGGGGGSYEEHFPAGSLVDWPATQSSSQGTSLLDAADNCSTCPGSPSGQALYFTTTVGGGWNRLTGYRQELLPAPIDTTGGGITVDFSLGYKKNIIGSSSGVWQRIYLELHDSTLGVTEELWRDISTASDNIWFSVSQTGVALTAGRNYDYVRISYDLRGRSGRVPEMWIDEINITSTGMSNAPNWQIIQWQEVNQ